MKEFKGNLKTLVMTLQEQDRAARAKKKKKGTPAPKEPYKSVVPSGKNKKK